VIGLSSRQELVNARTPVRILCSLASVAAATGAVFALRPVAPVLSLGVLYLFAVLPIAALWGLAYALAVSVLSMLAFNFLFLPPVHTLALRDSSNWVALAVYLVTAVVVSELSARSRRHARAEVEAETLRRSDAIKTNVLRTLSHDLRSPLTAIATAGDVLGGQPQKLTPAEQQELVATIRVQTQRLTRIVANLLDLSRLEAGAARPRFELWTADGLVARALEALGDDAARVEVVLPPESSPVRVDADQIERVLVNLLENALRASSPVDPVEVRCESDGREVVLRIVDHGPGIAGDPERLFEPFEHGPAESGTGTGLGLAIARGFVLTNGGRLWCESSPGLGATFALAFPLHAAPVGVAS
jgi:K+-sensing histidine kinase KdpD